MAVVLTMGTFDLLTSGHLFLFEQCRKIAGPHGQVIVTANSDEFVHRYKGSNPVMSLDERLHMLGSLRDISSAMVNFGDEDAASVIESINPDFLVIGQDWALKDYYGQLGITQEWLDERDISLIYLPRVKELSSTELKKRISSVS